MRNEADWRPSKYVVRRGRLSASRDTKDLALSSRLVASLVADAYQAHIAANCRGALLDLGCGLAPLYQTYRPHVESVTCVDLAIKDARKVYLDVQCDLAEPLPLSDGSFDTIIFSDVLEHLPDPALCWQEMHRVLRPGGRVLLNVPFLYRLHEEPYDFYRFTSHALRRFAEESGFVVRELSPVGGALEVMADIAGKILASRGRAAGRWLSARLQGSALMARRSRMFGGWSRRLSARYPIGYFMIAERS